MLNAIVGGELVGATPRISGECPACGSEVRSKCGSTVVWHWAHVTCKDCDEWHEPETDWHAAWKSRFAVTEKTIRRGDSWHRADAVTPSGVVVEFQHSTITSDEVAERERFYGNMVWVLDGTEAFQSKRIGLRHERPENGSPFCRFRWLHRKRSFDQGAAPLFVDLGVAFQDCGPSFYREYEWWDDDYGGLLDGVERPSGVWQRTKHLPMLLEIKKRKNAYGWGRVLTHSQFCTWYGASRCISPPAADGVCRIPSSWEAGDGYGYYTNENAPSIRHNGPYAWCKEQLSKGGNR